MLSEDKFKKPNLQNKDNGSGLVHNLKETNVNSLPGKLLPNKETTLLLGLLDKDIREFPNHSQVNLQQTPPQVRQRALPLHIQVTPIGQPVGSLSKSDQSVRSFVESSLSLSLLISDPNKVPFKKRHLIPLGRLMTQIRSRCIAKRNQEFRMAKNISKDPPPQLLRKRTQPTIRNKNRQILSASMPLGNTTSAPASITILSMTL